MSMIGAAGSLESARIRAVIVAVIALSTQARADDDPIATMERRQEQLFEKISPSVVFVSTGDAFGSGFFVESTGLILTNAHVVGDGQTVSVVTADGRKWQGQVIERGSGNTDLALVRIARTDAPVLELAPRADLRVGAWVASVGHGRGGVWTFNTGMVSNIYPDGAERPVFQTQIPLNPGCSGGPIVDRLGRVLGVVTAGLKDSNSINFAIRIDVAFKVLRKLAGHPAAEIALDDSLIIDAPAGVPVFVDGRMAGMGPRVVYAAAARTYEVSAVVGGAIKKRKVTFPEEKKVTLK